MRKGSRSKAKWSRARSQRLRKYRRSVRKFAARLQESSKAQPSAQQSSHFFRLPQELRDIIYELVFEPRTGEPWLQRYYFGYEIRVELDPWDRVRVPKTFSAEPTAYHVRTSLALLQVCRRMRSEIHHSWRPMAYFTRRHRSGPVMRLHRLQKNVTLQALSLHILDNRQPLRLKSFTRRLRSHMMPKMPHLASLPFELQLEKVISTCYSKSVHGRDCTYVGLVDMGQKIEFDRIVPKLPSLFRSIIHVHYRRVCGKDYWG